MNKIKVGVVCICLNPPYWQFAGEMLWGLNTFFLKHPSIRDKYDVKMLLWSDIPEKENDIIAKIVQYYVATGQLQPSMISSTEMQTPIPKDKEPEFKAMIQGAINVRKTDIQIFPTEPVEWPMPTLMRYHLFMQQREELEKFDYIFYIDVDMRITDWINEDILQPDHLTCALHPMYALKESYFPPYDPNPQSEAYIKLPGSYIDDGRGGKKFRPEYYAGGFQGGDTKVWIKAMQEMTKMIDKDMMEINYIPRWNDESIFNSYVFRHPELKKVVLGPGYIYPDSLIENYYVKLWGRNYSPKIMTLTKSFTTSKEGGDAVKQLVAL